MERYAVAYHDKHVTIEPSTCSFGCACTSDDPCGLSFDEACNMVAEWYEQEAQAWRDRTSFDAKWYSDSWDD